MRLPRLLAAASLVALALAACSSPPPVAQPPGALALPAPATPPATMTLRAVRSGVMFSSASMAYEGGRGDDQRTFSIGGILVDHPQGRLLFDAGFGRDVDKHFKTTPMIMQLASKYRLDKPVAEQLVAGGVPIESIKAIVLTHAHWDHVSGLQHFPTTPVWVDKAELAFAQGDADGAKLAKQIGVKNYKAYDFPNGPYLGFEKSWDVFADGSLVLVPAPGHTPGSIVAFINTPDGKRYALIGDTAWQGEGISLPAQKPILARWADEDAKGTWAMISRLHALKAAVPDLIIVPAHDDRVFSALPQFGK